MQPSPSRHNPGLAKRRRLAWITRDLKISSFFVITASVLVIALLAIWLVFTVPNIKPESSQINKSEYQAVFLTNGQVYFGKIGTLNGSYLTLTNVFYLQSNSSSSSTSSPQPKSNSNLTLVKLGVSELHAPEDKMVINQQQISFWENLKSSSKVVSAINQYYQNPSGSSSSQVQSGSSNTTGQ